MLLRRKIYRDPPGFGSKEELSKASDLCEANLMILHRFFFIFVPSKLFCSVGVACIFLQDLAQKIGKTFKAAKEAMSAVTNMTPAESL